MITPEHLAWLSREGLLALVAERQSPMTALPRQVADLVASTEALQAELD